MNLFRKIYSVVLVLFILVVAFITFKSSSGRIAEIEKLLIEKQRVTGTLATSEIQRWQSEGKWPFIALKAMTEQDDFLFWWIVTDNNIIHLADDVDYVGTDSSTYFPEIRDLMQPPKETGNIVLNQKKSYGIYSQVFTVGNERWTFWLGFSTKTIREAKNQIISSSLLYTCIGLLFLGVILFLVVRTFLQPLKALAEGAQKIGEGDFSYRLHRSSKDEIGIVAQAFNQMAKSLQDDILKRKKVEEELRFTQFAVDCSSEAAYWITPDAKIEYANEAACQKLGYSQEEFFDMSVADVDPNYPQDAWEDHWQELKQQKSLQFESVHRRKDGTIFPVELAANYIEYNGRAYNCAFVRDISERKNAEQEKVQLESELRQAQKMESIGRLAGGIAHDFNNILSVINGYSEICLMKMEDNNPLQKDIEFIMQAGERAARLTQQLLAFSRKQIIKQELLNLNNEVDSVRKMLGHLLGENVEIEIDHGKDLWPVMTDCSQMEQVIMNLAVNARDAMSSEGGKLIIETANVSLDGGYLKTHYDITPGDYVMLAVSDNGMGMDKETMEKIFDPFFTTKERGKGTGLGLSTVFGIIKQNNGEIQVYSEPGQGTTFKIYLPRADEPLKVIDDFSSVEDICDNQGMETIMLVEDDEMVRKLCINILADLGYTVLEAENGEDALHVCERYHGVIDLLLTDVVMPKLSGPQLAVKVQELCPQIQVLFMSGYTENAIVKHGVLKDGVSFIHKPITQNSLSQAVRKVLG